MSLMKILQNYIAENPGVASNQIADAFPGFARTSVQRAVCRLYDTGRAEREMENDQYRYKALPPKTPVAMPDLQLVDGEVKAKSLEMQARELQAKGLYNRAATLLLDAFSTSSVTSERERCLRERQRCLRKAVSPVCNSGAGNLPGRYIGGDE